MNQLKQFIFIVSSKEVKWIVFDEINTMLFVNVDDSDMSMYRAGQLLLSNSLRGKLICKFGSTSLDQAKESLESLLEAYYSEVVGLNEVESLKAVQQDLSVNFREISIEEMKKFLTVS